MSTCKKAQNHPSLPCRCVSLCCRAGVVSLSWSPLQTVLKRGHFQLHPVQQLLLCSSLEDLTSQTPCHTYSGTENIVRRGVNCDTAAVLASLSHFASRALWGFNGTLLQMDGDIKKWLSDWQSEGGEPAPTFSLPRPLSIITPPLKDVTITSCS